MSWKKLLFIGIITAMCGYYLYTPIPAGYSSSSARRLQIILASLKLTDSLWLLKPFVGFRSVIDMQRELFSSAAAYMDELDPAVKEMDATFDGVPVRIYEPADRADSVLPGIVFYHGGGFTMGSVNEYGRLSRKLCKEVNAVVISVDYRRAPELPFPVPFEDSLKATKYFMTNAKKFKVDPRRIAVAGDSAGGNFAAAISLQLRNDKFKPDIKLQVLIYPHVEGLNFRLPSMMQNENGPLLTRRAMAFFLGMYLDGNPDKIEIYLNNDHVSPEFKQKNPHLLDLSLLPAKYLIGYEEPSVETGNETVWNEMKGKLLNPNYSPLVAKKLDNLPPAYVFTAEYDPLRDEGLMYVSRLKKAGVKVEHVHSDIGIHGVMSLHDLLPEADEMFRSMTSFIASNL